ncbi:hypothetical protein FYK55_23685 [Roseiconus nitratireducens]|uniref:Secreted protein n=1 Tax=Roseiconus nitratireducens TaxID=2605748 RepID=A0A5M6D1Q2_9BACT|nr:hypothetical protein [Roseiconus nitratireducens]KAA5539579.1 hypothetical protein FYK55_23685 [Roseiconus nitratireducens]
MKPFLKLALLCALATPSLLGCSDPEPTVVEPTDEEQLQLMRDMVAGETQAVDQADEQRQQ